MNQILKDIKVITELSENEVEWWRSQIGKVRSRCIPKPSAYVDKYFSSLSKEDVARKLTKPSDLIGEIRDVTWNWYIIDEVIFCKEILKVLSNRTDPAEILQALVNEDFYKKVVAAKNPQELLANIKEIFGEYSGRIFPYIYDLAKSMSQSRRSRAGSTFEAIIRKLMEENKYPYDSQSKIGKKVFHESGLGKKVDGVVPSIEKYTQHRNHCIVVTMKTTLRERWQQVVEELKRTNVPSIYLLTLDDGIGDNLLSMLNEYNVTLVCPDKISNKFKQKNIISMEKFFSIEIPHTLDWWNKND